MNEIKIGQEAPEFELKNQDNRSIRLSNYLNKVVVLYFYPKDDTPGCTRQACNFKDARDEYLSSGAVVIGISRDSVDSHKKFWQKYNLNFDILSDPSGKVHQLYDVFKNKQIFGKIRLGVERSTFIIDKQGKIVGIFRGVKLDEHNQEVLSLIKNLS